MEEVLLLVKMARLMVQDTAKYGSDSVMEFQMGVVVVSNLLESVEIVKFSIGSGIFYWCSLIKQCLDILMHHIVISIAADETIRINSITVTYNSDYPCNSYSIASDIFVY